MSTIRIPLRYHDHGGGITIEAADDTGDVWLTILPEDDRTSDQRTDAERTLTASEARTLAAALVHFANEAVR